MSVEMIKVSIGARWRPGHRVFRDDEAGTYSEVNSPMINTSEKLVQRALLAPPPKRNFMGRLSFPRQRESGL